MSPRSLSMVGTAGGCSSAALSLASSRGGWESLSLMRWSLLAGVAVGPPMTGREVVPLRASRGRSASAS